jgi:opacity protein-like surface antigen
MPVKSRLKAILAISLQPFQSLFWCHAFEDLSREELMRMIATVAVLLTAGGLLSAQEGSGWVALQAGSISQPSDSPFKAGPALGVGVGGWFTNWFGAEASVLNSRMEVKESGLKGDATHAMVSGLLGFNPGGATWIPFIRLGLGAVACKGDLKDVEGDRRATYHAGLGLQGHFGRNLLGMLEFRGIRVGKKDPKRNETLGLVGFGYRWGGSTRVGKSSPASSEPLVVNRPMVQVVPDSPQQPVVEAMPVLPQKPAVEALPAVSSQRPAVEALPTAP